jgi:hypothetical protein
MCLSTNLFLPFPADLGLSFPFADPFFSFPLSAAA